MRINSITLENFQSYKEESLNLDDGVILIYGENGAGKSTLLRSIFAGLFQTESTRNSNFTLGELVKKGYEKATVNLEFTVNTNNYQVNWVIEISDSESDPPKAQTKECSLVINNDKQISGVTNVGDYLSNELGMDAETFISTVYIQQNEIQNIIDSDPDVRKKTLDDLLGLNEIDNTIERLNKGRREIKSIKRNRKERKENLEAKVEDIDISETKERVSKLETGKQNVSRKIEELDTKMKELKDKKREIENQLQNLEEKEEEKEKLKNEIQQINEEIDDAEEKINKHEGKIEELKEDKQETYEKLENFARNISDIKESINEKEEEVEEFRQKVQNIDKQVNNIEFSINMKESEIENLKEEKEERKKENEKLNDKMKNLEKKLEEYNKKFKEEAEEVVSVLEDSEHIDKESIINIAETIKQVEEDHQERLSELKSQFEEKIENVDGYNNYKKALQEEIDTSNNRINKIQESNYEKCIEYLDEIDSLKNNLNEIDRDVENNKNKIEEIKKQIKKKENDKEELKKKKHREKQKLDEKRDKLEQKEEKIEAEKLELENHEKLNELEQKIEETRNNVETYEDLKRSKERDKKTKQQKIEEIENEYDKKAIEEKKQEVIEIKEELKNKKSEKEDLENQKDQKQKEILSLENEIEKKKEIQDEIRDLEKIINSLEEKRKETVEMIELYEKTKNEYRANSIKLVNKYSNQIFQSIYENQTYTGLEIDKNYEIHLNTNEGDKIKPRIASGGEKAIIALAIRSSIYRLISERNEIKSLPPLIMDEPTNNLDKNHVQKLGQLMKEMKNWNIEQILIISHEPTIIDSADEAYEAKKHPVTENSNIVKNKGGTNGQ